LQIVFASFDKGSYHWDQDPNLSDIIISDQSTINREVVERRPAIMVARGAASFTNVSMNQVAGPLLQKNPDGSTSFTPNVDPGTGARRFTDLIAATMTYNILSREGLEAQRIAWTCMYATRTLKKSLLRAGLHRVGEDLSVGAESSPGSIVQPDSNEVVMVSVQVPFFFQDTWTKTPLDKTLLTQVDVALSSELGANAPAQVQIKSPSIYGKNLGSNQARWISAGPWKSPKPLK
jgi:hypothetical protein